MTPRQGRMETPTDKQIISEGSIDGKDTRLRLTDIKFGQVTVDYKNGLPFDIGVDITCKLNGKPYGFNLGTLCEGRDYFEDFYEEFPEERPPEEDEE